MRYRSGDYVLDTQRRSMVGEHVRSLVVLGEAAALARQLDDRARLGRALSRVVTVRIIAGDLDGAMAAGWEALELATILGDLALHVHASYRVGQAYASIGDYSYGSGPRLTAQASGRNSSF